MKYAIATLTFLMMAAAGCRVQPSTERLPHADLFALIHRQFVRAHPEWFDAGNYRPPTLKEARKFGPLREAERCCLRCLITFCHRE